MNQDPEFFIDVQAEMNTAYEYGIDGAQQALEKYDIHAGDIGQIALFYATQDGNNYEQANRWAILLDKK